MLIRYDLVDVVISVYLQGSIMHVQKVSMEGFLHFREQRTVEMNRGVTAYTGPSGSGKSTIFQAIRWCIFGTLRADDIESVINDASTKATVSVVFTHDGATYRVTRTRGRGVDGRTGPTSMLLEQVDSRGGWKTVGKKGVNAVTKNLDVIFGVDMPLMETTMFTGDTGFVAATPEDRRGILLSMLPDTRSWERHHKKMTDEHKAAKNELRDFEKTLDDLKDYKAETERSLVAAREYADTLRPAHVVREALEAASVAAGGNSGDRGRRLAELARKREEKNAEHDKNYQDTLSSFSELENYYDDLEKSFADTTKYNQGLDASQQDLSKATTNIRGTKRDQASAEKRLRDVTAELAVVGTNLQAAVDKLSLVEASLLALPTADGCPTCETPLTDLSREALHDQLQGDADTLKSEIDSLEKQQRTANKAAGEAESEVADLEGALKKLERTKTDAEQAVNKFTNRLEKEQTRRSTIVDAVSRIIGTPLKNDKSVLATLDSYLDDLDAVLLKGVVQEPKSEEELLLESDAGDLKDATEDLQYELAIVENAHGRVEELEDALEEVTERISEQSDIVDEVKREVAMLANLREACSPKGVPTSIMSRVLGGVEFHLNSLLASVGRSTMSVEFSTSRTSRTGREKPSLDILVKMSGVVRPVEALSGGERALISVASMAALGLWINEEAGDVVEDLYFDETLGAMDTDLSARALRALFSAVEEKFAAVHVITHDPNALSRVAGCRLVKMGEPDLAL